MIKHEIQITYNPTANRAAIRFYNGANTTKVNFDFVKIWAKGRRLYFLPSTKEQGGRKISSCNNEILYGGDYATSLAKFAGFHDLVWDAVTGYYYIESLDKDIKDGKDKTAESNETSKKTTAQVFAEKYVRMFGGGEDTEGNEAAVSREKAVETASVEEETSKELSAPKLDLSVKEELKEDREIKAAESPAEPTIADKLTNVIFDYLRRGELYKAQAALEVGDKLGIITEVQE